MVDKGNICSCNGIMKTRYGGLVKEGSDVTEFQESDRGTGDSNVCQILRKAVSVSETAQAVSQEHIADLFAHETQNRIKK